MVYVVTTAKKGEGKKIKPSKKGFCPELYSDLCHNTAKHLEPLKGGKIPVEILVTTKDPEQKKQAFGKCLDAIKNSGVSVTFVAIYDDDRGRTD